jgi:hypothetical protein
MITAQSKKRVLHNEPSSWRRTGREPPKQLEDNLKKVIEVLGLGLNCSASTLIKGIKDNLESHHPTAPHWGVSPRVVEKYPVLFLLLQNGEYREKCSVASVDLFDVLDNPFLRLPSRMKDFRGDAKCLMTMRTPFPIVRVTKEFGMEPTTRREFTKQIIIIVKRTDPPVVLTIHPRNITSPPTLSLTNFA